MVSVEKVTLCCSDTLCLWWLVINVTIYLFPCSGLSEIIIPVVLFLICEVAGLGSHCPQFSVFKRLAQSIFPPSHKTRFWNLGKVVFAANYLKVIWQSNSNQLEYEIWLSKEKILSFLCTLCWLHFMFLDCPSMPPCQLQPCLHISSKPSMSQKRLKILKTKKSEFETNEKSLDPTTDCYFPNMKPFFSLIWEHSSLSWLHHPHNLETHLKFPKNCLIWDKKTIIINKHIY